MQKINVAFDFIIDPKNIGKFTIKLNSHFLLNQFFRLSFWQKKEFVLFTMLHIEIVCTFHQNLLQHRGYLFCFALFCGILAALKQVLRIFKCGPNEQEMGWQKWNESFTLYLCTSFNIWCNFKTTYANAKIHWYLWFEWSALNSLSCLIFLLFLFQLGRFLIELEQSIGLIINADRR